MFSEWVATMASRSGPRDAHDYPLRVRRLRRGVPHGWSVDHDWRGGSSGEAGGDGAPCQTGRRNPPHEL